MTLETDKPFFSVCPHCGYDLVVNQVIVLGKWTLYPNQTVYDGGVLDFTGQQSEFLYSIAKSHPRILSTNALIQRMELGSSNHVSVLRSRIADKLRFAKIQLPIANRKGEGYFWVAT